MRYMKSITLAGLLLASALAVGAAPEPAEAQVCGRPGPKKGCVQKGDIKKSAVDSSRVKNNSLKSADVKDGTLTGADVKNNSLTGADIQDQSLTGADFQDGGISAADLAPGTESDTLADLNCSIDQIARFIDGAWECVTGGGAYVFLTKGTIEGGAGVAAMDALCQSEAETATPNKLPAGTYRAWLSSNAFDAKDMLPPGPFYLPDGALVALSKADMLDEKLLTAIEVLSTGAALVSGDTGVWTGTSAAGIHSGQSCNGWASSSSGDSGTRGKRDETDATWTDNGTSACDQEFRLYCVQVQ